MSGRLDAVSVLDLLDWLCTNRKSWTLRLFSDGTQGQVAVVHGELLHARYGLSQGLPALAEIVACHRGHFDLVPVGEVNERNLRGHWRSLLLGAAQLADGQRDAEAMADGDLDSDAWAPSTGGRRADKERG